jgi:uracil-DNA glycosylase
MSGPVVALRSRLTIEPDVQLLILSSTSDFNSSMRGAVEYRSDHPIGNLLGWWELAGVNTLVSENQHGWLALNEPAAPAIQTSIPAMPSHAREMPSSIPDFLAWRETSPDVPEAAWGGARIVPGVAIPAEIMVIADMPDLDDMETGTLLSNATGRLFDRMLAAIGLQRSTIHLASLACARPPGGMLDLDSGNRLAQIMRRHIALIAPKHILLLGDKTSRALMAADAGGGRGKLQTLNHDNGTVEAVATFHPRFLMRQPAAKAECWRDLQLFAKDIVS